MQRLATGNVRQLDDAAATSVDTHIIPAFVVNRILTTICTMLPE
jgi:hypothetical protein